MHKPLRAAAAALLLLLALVAPFSAFAAERVTIHLDEHNGYFSAKETLAGLKPGEYEFVVTNKAGKTVGFERSPEISMRTPPVRGRSLPRETGSTAGSRL